MSVLVVGGGLSGLSTAMFMALHGAPPLLVEKHPTTSVHPKARGQFPHVMEALRVAGVDERVLDDRQAFRLEHQASYVVKPRNPG